MNDLSELRSELPQDLNVVLLHDWLTGFRGGERVLEVFCELFPDAPLYTLLHKKGSTSEIIENRRIETSFLDKIPGIYSHYRKFLPLFPLAASGLKIREQADVVLSSSHCVIKGVKKPKGSTHLSYIHSPMRYIYDQYDAYFGPDAPFYQRLGMKLFKNYLTNWDLASNENVDYPIANASFVRERIQRYYGIDSEVIHPFVELKDFADVHQSPPAKEHYYVMVTAFAPNKRVDLAIDTFNKLGFKLKIIGSGQQEGSLKARARENIEFMGNTSREEVIQTLARAQALIFPGVEDFGITPLEALAAGTPVIAYRSGGVLETLDDSVAIFFDRQTDFDLSEAIRRFRERALERPFSRERLWQRAEEFSREKFAERIVETLKQALN